MGHKFRRIARFCLRLPAAIRLDGAVNLTRTLMACAAIALPPGIAKAQGSCDRDCLQKFIARYVDAMVKHDASSLPLAPGATATQNGKPLVLGQGVWQSITGVLSQPQYISDVAAQQAGYIGVIADAGKPAFFGLRLKIVGNKIAEIETLLTREAEGGPAFEPQGFIYREAPYIRDVPLTVRSSPAELLRVANVYWDVATSSHDAALIPYSVDCWHFENGMNTDWERSFNATETAQLNQPAYRPQAFDGRIWTCAREAYLTTASWKLAHDRHFLVDPERGLVLNIVTVDVAAGAGAAGPRRAGGPGGPRAVPDPIEGPGAMPLGMSMAGMMSTAGRNYSNLHFEVMRLVGGKITREQDLQHVLTGSTD